MARLEAHLREHYGIDVKSIKELDQCVFVVTGKTRGEKWVARVDNVGRPWEQSAGDAEFLRYLEAQGFPAERIHEMPDFRGGRGLDDHGEVKEPGGIVAGSGSVRNPGAAQSPGAKRAAPGARTRGSSAGCR